jgi:cellobiose phosphorylase
MEKEFNYGGLAAKEGKGPLWKFTEKKDGSFTCPNPEYVSSLYFPLMNEAGMRCWTTPELKGDIAIGYHHYLNTPTATDELWRSSSSKNFWIQVQGKTPWSATGVSANRNINRWDKEMKDSSFLEAGIGWFKLERQNSELGLKATSTEFVPSSPDFVEIILTEIENIGNKDITFKGTIATPLFGRSTENLRDHKHVTTLFQKIWLDKFGVRIKGNIVHDERGGHIPNLTYYGVYGCTGDGVMPTHMWGSMIDFIGEGGSLDNPEAIYKNLIPPIRPEGDMDGEEAIGALQFYPVTLKPGEKKSFITLHLISENPDDFKTCFNKYNSTDKVLKSLEETKNYWQQMVNNVSFATQDENFNNWCRWLSYQVKCRQVFGNAYLPDFDYGKGGRGWRDLWQDLLAIFLIDPDSARQEIINNFYGVRIDGTNANLIGNKSGEFFSDVNRIDRTWSDHSSWPFYVVNFYIQQTGDYDLLLKKVPYWKDHVFRRSKDIDKDYNEKIYGNRLKDLNDNIYEGTILEHLILQNVCSFFNVGKNNNILLEAADWNDTYDNARQKGESVCFYNFFANNLGQLANILESYKAKGITDIELLEETMVLFDNIAGQKKVDYDSPDSKQERLQTYHNSIRHKVSGKTKKVNIDFLIRDLKTKSDYAYAHIRKNEWLTTKDGFSFFNGHYDNDGVRIHGDHPLGTRIDLTSQVLPTMFNTATDEIMPVIYQSVMHYLHDKTTGGLRLNTDLKELKLNLGRVAAFAYGYKEHGSKWMHQNIMFLYGLYSRGFVNEGYEVFKGIYNLVMDSGQSKIFPSIPSFFNKKGRGMYVYLTGSATWFIMAFTTQVFGIRGEKGDLCIHPKLTKEQFSDNGEAGINCYFRNRKIKLTYSNPSKKDWNEYKINSVLINGKPIQFNALNNSKALIAWDLANEALNKEENLIVVNLV